MKLQKSHFVIKTFTINNYENEKNKYNAKKIYKFRLNDNVNISPFKHTIEPKYPILQIQNKKIKFTVQISH